MTALTEATWPDVERLRGVVGTRDAPSVEAAAGSFVNAFSAVFSDIALVRLFIVLPVADVPDRERAFATRLAGQDSRFGPATRVLTLLGTRGLESSWNNRHLSKDHLCLPLIDRAFIDAAPMIAKLLADIDVDLAAFDDGRPIASRMLLGGKNGMFYVPDAPTAIDAKGRHVIGNRPFVERYGIRTVFGMGGAYVNGPLVISIVFSTSLIPRLIADRFPSLISNFKMATSKLVEQKRIFDLHE